MTPLENRLKASRRTAKLKKWLADPLTTLFVSIAVLATLALGVKNTYAHDQLAKCLANYNEQDALVTQQRQALADQDRALDTEERELDRQEAQAFRDLIAALRVTPGNQQQAQVAWANYLTTFDSNNAKRAELTKKRAENAEARKKIPVPQRPSLACG